MEQRFYSPVPLKHISEVGKEAVKYIRQRKNHEIQPLKTRWNKFNIMCGGGIEPGCVYTIAGTSGTGKSAFINCIENDLIEMNPGKELVILSFSFEMLSMRTFVRKLSNKLHQTTLDLYSAYEDVSEDTMKQIQIEVNKMSNYPIYYVETSTNVEKIEETIKYFQNTVAKDKWLIVFLDHTLLVDSSGKDERRTIADLQKVFIKYKQVGKTSIIQLSQMNRNIETPERILNPTSHYPMRSDLSSSDSIFQGSDIVAVLSRPELLNIAAYGVQKLPVQNKVYLHFLKVREGVPAILEFENNLKYNDLIEN